MMRDKRREDDNGEAETKHESSPESFVFPPEIIMEILLRLPARTIGRFRCVSKLFRSLSTDPGFAKSHLDLILRNGSLRLPHRKLIVSSHNLYALKLDSIGDGRGRIRDLAPVELNYPLKDDPSIFDEMIRSYVREHLHGGGSDTVVDEDDRRVMLKLNAKSYRRNWVEIIGSSNGLLCISPGGSAIFFYNPTTGESKRLPETARPKSKEYGEQFQTYGFGFDDLTCDYKVVKLIADNDDVINASVYSLKSDTWRRIGDLRYEHNDGFHSGVNFNGAIHWVFTLKEGDQSQRLVLAFDLETEAFREMPLPDEAEDCPHRFKNFVVGNLNGRLCVTNSCYEVHDDVWVMNEYGEASSWSRIRISLLYRSLKPLCSLAKNREEVLMELDGEMVLYNFATDASRSLGIRGVKLRDGFEANTYVESLISPNSYGIRN
ncbi:unnamed protein product [Microthlaspi erraticum]|uniref:F-box domain-containing protein n=1 Tax=Microthlaspi erraticum TaxID=1685480 RepID=A0A6D2HRC3_9BRAS|nr:unnamed protein product [Microthlaspi erraticum]